MTRPAFMSRETLAEMLDLKPGAVDQLVARGLIPQPVMIGDAKRWNWSEVERWLTNARQVPDADASELFKERAAAHAAKATAPRQPRAQQG